MIPRVIHYCWFGRNPLPEVAQKCITSWKEYLPDYEIKEWNEDNFDVNAVQYVKDAYAAKKYAFVSDYARFWILYNYGGLYFDTDVEIIRPLDQVISNGPFMGCEQDYMRMPNGSMVAGKGNAVNPGLGVCAEPQMDFFREILDMYATISFLNADGSLNEKTVVSYVSEMLLQKGMTEQNEIQTVAGFKIYPKEYFAPKDYLTNKINIHENTLTIHHYDASWHNKNFWVKFVEFIKNDIIIKILPQKIVDAVLSLKKRKRTSGSFF